MVNNIFIFSEIICLSIINFLFSLGIGKEMARILSASNPKRLILPVRNKEKGNNLLKYIKFSNGNADNAEIWDMDLADLQSVKNFANKFINEVGELHMLINNAGK